MVVMEEVVAKAAAAGPKAVEARAMAEAAAAVNSIHPNRQYAYAAIHVQNNR